VTVTLPAQGSTAWYPWAQDVTTAVNSTPATVTYGTTAGTAAQGNDSRITGAVQNAAGVARIQVLTAAAYAALGTKVADTLYVLVG
jgi:hypothetical protein